MLKIIHGLIGFLNVYISGGLPIEYLNGLRLLLYKCVNFVDVVRKVRKDPILPNTKELAMAIYDQLVPGLSLVKPILEMIPKGNRRKAGAALAEQLESQLTTLAKIVGEVSDATPDPLQKFALQQHAAQLAGLSKVADSISDILVGEDDVPPK